MLIAASLTHNDKSKGMLNTWIEENIKFFDKWVILDDFSSDGTFEEIINLRDSKIEISQTPIETFKINESSIRHMLWESVRKVAKPGDYIIVLDSDEIICPEFLEMKKELMKKQALISFKKIEFWNEKEYRIDGLWSNFFCRMFPFRDNIFDNNPVPGFHKSPTPYYSLLLPVYNSNVRIKHFAYITEEKRNSKYNFMMSNEQQTKDITYKHLQTINKPAKLKEYKDEVEYEELTIAFFFSDLYRLNDELKDFLNYIHLLHQEEKLNIVFYVSNCSSRLISEIEDLELKVQSVEFRLFNYQKKILGNRRALIKKEFLNTLLFKDIDNLSEHYILVDGDYKPNYNFIKDNLILEKDVAIMRQEFKSLYLSKNAIIDALSFMDELSTTRDENLLLCGRLSSLNYFVWGNVYGNPFPINIKNN